jgi:serine protease
LLADGWRVGDGTGARIDAALAARPELADPRRVWRVPAERVPALRATGLVEAAWGHPEPAPPPYDIPPETPLFDPAQRAFDAPPAGTGVRWARAWPGADGFGVAVIDIEYDFDPEHEALLGNPPEIGPGSPAGQWDYHGNAVLGLIAAGDVGFGVIGAAPAATARVVYPLVPTYDVATAVLRAADGAAPGDIVVIQQQLRTALGFGPVSADPATFAAIAVAVAAGVTVVEPAGNGSVDLDDPRFEGWFDPENDSGAILVASAVPDTGAPSPLTNRGRRVDLHARAGHLIAPTTEEFSPDLFFPDGDRRQAYTSVFSGTSGSAALVAGACASLQGIARGLRGEPMTPEALRAALRVAGRAHVPSVDGPRIGAPLDVRRAIQLWLAP